MTWLFLTVMRMGAWSVTHVGFTLAVVSAQGQFPSSSGGSVVAMGVFGVGLLESQRHALTHVTDASSACVSTSELDGGIESSAWSFR